MAISKVDEDFLEGFKNYLLNEKYRIEIQN
ncbi:hypothetical protein [Riemerella anatipestifer]|nr:hypothetical protein [Riemerella anatipestifer]